MLFREIFFICFGYLLGSILFARLFGLLFAHKDITQNTADGNPGTANAFLQGGFLCGVCTLLGDLFKGYLPVAWYLSTQSQSTVPPLAFALLIGDGAAAYFSLKLGAGERENATCTVEKGLPPALAVCLPCCPTRSLC